MTNLLADFPVIYEADIVWGDMDAFQHVNNVAYFRYYTSQGHKLNFFDLIKGLKI